MNKLFMSLLFLSINFSLLNAQVYKFQTTGYSVSNMKNNKWSEWSAFIPSEMIVSFDSTKNRIVVFSQDVQLFNIITYEAEKETADDLTYTFTCVDSEGTPCGITIITRKTQGNRRQLYINYPKKIIVYNMYLYTEKQ